MSYEITPIRSDFLTQVRKTGIDDLGQPVEYIEAEGGEPCRDVLRRALVGEKLILASYSPFEIAGPYKEYGPIFVLANASDERVDYANLPLANAGVADYLAQVFVIKAYCQNERIVDARLSTPLEVESDLNYFLSKDEVDFVLVRFAAYGCYGFRLDPVRG